MVFAKIVGIYYWISNKESEFSAEAAVHRCFTQKAVSKNFSKFTEKHLNRSFFLVKLHGYSLKLYLKRGSGTVAFLWVL